MYCSYTNYLFDKGIDKILKKLGEEATEIVIAAKNPNANEIGNMPVGIQCKFIPCDFGAISIDRNAVRLTQCFDCLKFGKDKIVACISDIREITDNTALLEDYVEELILVKERCIKEAIAVSPLPMIVSVPRDFRFRADAFDDIKRFFMLRVALRQIVYD